MPADKGFHDRIRRIETGRTWAPDGVIHCPPGRRQDKRGRSGGAGLTILMTLALPVALLLVGPDALPEPVQGFLSAPTTEAAMASLGQWELLADIGR